LEEHFAEKARMQCLLKRCLHCWTSFWNWRSIHLY
jgi:hypothetical protein